MNKYLSDIGLLIFRIAVGSFLAFGHGLGKLTRSFSGEEIRFMNFIGLGQTTSFFLAMSAEFFCALLIALGLFTRLNSIPIIITMFVAAFVAHGDDPFSGKEKSLLFLVSFLLLFFTGPGRYSLQSLFSSKLEKLKSFPKFILS